MCKLINYIIILVPTRTYSRVFLPYPHCHILLIVAAHTGPGRALSRSRFISIQNQNYVLIIYPTISKIIFDFSPVVDYYKIVTHEMLVALYRDDSIE